MRRRGQGLQVSTFPFLAVLLCTMGSLILLLLVIDRRAKAVARAKAMRAAARQTEEQSRQEAARRAEWERRRRALHALLARQDQALRAGIKKLDDEARDQETRLQAGQARYRTLRQKIRDEQTRQDRAREQLATGRVATERSAGREKAARKDLARLATELGRLQQTLADLRLLRRQDRQTYSLVPYRGRHGDNRRPVYVECAADALIFHPDGVVLRGPEVTFGAVLAEVQRQVARQKAAGEGGKGNAPYLLLLVRPDGVSTYYRFLAAIQGLGFDYGYEFVESDWVLDFGAEAGPGGRPAWMTGAAPASRPGLSRRTPKRQTAPTGGQLAGVGSSGPGPAGGAAAGGSGAVEGGGEPGGPGTRGVRPGGGNLTGAAPGGPSRGPAATGTSMGKGSPGLLFRGNGQSINPALAEGLPVPNQSMPAKTPLFGGPPGFPPGGSLMPPAGSGAPATGATNAGPGARAEIGSPGGPGRAAPAGLNKAGPPSLLGTAVPLASEAGPKGGGGGNPSRGSGHPSTGMEPHSGSSGGGTPTQADASHEETSQTPGEGATGSPTSGGVPSRTAIYSAGGSKGQGQGDGFTGSGAGGLPGASGTGRAPARETPWAPPPGAYGDRDWIIPVECTADGVLLRITRQHFPTADLYGASGPDHLLARSVRQLIARRQALVRPGEPPYRPRIRFLVRPDGQRTYYLAYPLLEGLGVPMARQDLEKDVPEKREGPAR